MKLKIRELDFEVPSVIGVIGVVLTVCLALVLYFVGLNTKITATREGVGIEFSRSVPAPKEAASMPASMEAASAPPSNKPATMPSSNDRLSPSNNGATVENPSPIGAAQIGPPTKPEKRCAVGKCIDQPGKMALVKPKELKPRKWSPGLGYFYALMRAQGDARTEDEWSLVKLPCVKGQIYEQSFMPQ
jgi:hypothetical protein